jgi:hypothetical protein
VTGALKDLFGKSEGRKPLEIHRRRWERIILKRILTKQVLRVWTGFIWLRMGKSGGLL